MTYSDAPQLLRFFEGEGFGDHLLTSPCLTGGEAGVQSNVNEFYIHLKDSVRIPSIYGCKKTEEDDDCNGKEEILENTQNIDVFAVTAFFESDGSIYFSGVSYNLLFLLERLIPNQFAE